MRSRTRRSTASQRAVRRRSSSAPIRVDGRSDATAPRGGWPRDRPIRWSGVVNNLTWYVVATVALLLQIALALPVLLLGGGVAGTVLALVWGAMTLLAAWSWITWRWRVVVAPLVTIGAILVRAAVGGL
jgi:hypothetical protein